MWNLYVGLIRHYRKAQPNTHEAKVGEKTKTKRNSKRADETSDEKASSG